MAKEMVEMPNNKKIVETFFIVTNHYQSSTQK